jgi:hypothetical protein
MHVVGIWLRSYTQLKLQENRYRIIHLIFI